MNGKAEYYRDFLISMASTALDIAGELEKLPISDRKSRMSIQRKISAEYAEITDALPGFYDRTAKDFITPIERGDLSVLSNLLASSVRECNLLSQNMCTLKTVNTAYLSSLLRQIGRYCVIICEILKSTDFFKKCTSVSDFVKRLYTLKTETDKAYLSCISAVQSGDAERYFLCCLAKSCCSRLENAADKAIEILIKNV